MSIKVRFKPFHNWKGFLVHKIDNLMNNLEGIDHRL